MKRDSAIDRMLGRIVGSALLANPSQAQREALAALRVQMVRHGVCARAVEASDAELLDAVRRVARVYRDKGEDVYLLAAGMEHCGQGFVLLM